MVFGPRGSAPRGAISPTPLRLRFVLQSVVPDPSTGSRTYLARDEHGTPWMSHDFASAQNFPTQRLAEREKTVVRAESPDLGDLAVAVWPLGKHPDGHFG